MWLLFKNEVFLHFGVSPSVRLWNNEWNNCLFFMNFRSLILIICNICSYSILSIFVWSSDLLNFVFMNVVIIFRVLMFASLFEEKFVKTVKLWLATKLYKHRDLRIGLWKIYLYNIFVMLSHGGRVFPNFFLAIIHNYSINHFS